MPCAYMFARVHASTVCDAVSPCVLPCPSWWPAILSRSAPVFIQCVGLVSGDPAGSCDREMSTCVVGCEAEGFQLRLGAKASKWDRPAPRLPTFPSLHNSEARELALRALYPPAMTPGPCSAPASPHWAWVLVCSANLCCPLWQVSQALLTQKPKTPISNSFSRTTCLGCACP